jgi:hypothetical protein
MTEEEIKTTLWETYREQLPHDTPPKLLECMQVAFFAGAAYGLGAREALADEFGREIKEFERCCKRRYPQ